MTTAIPLAIRCYGYGTCEAPAGQATVSITGESITIGVCGVHVDAISRLGFLVTPIQREMNIREYVKDFHRKLAQQSPGITHQEWSELTIAERTWCKCGCKVFVRKFGTGYAFMLRHNPTYGCSAGVR